jgi:hypothetical protein
LRKSQAIYVLEDFTKANQLNPDDALPYFNIGILLSGTEKSEIYNGPPKLDRVLRGT